ncbi:DNA repair and recombination protein RadB [Candidatus Woesearchaeota archaeon]|nr:DNA repair and recombination protein RadB [Candidatus Woesearchaeota archaeon]
MVDSKVTTGSEVLDWLLEGGYEKEVITTIYGPAGSGKTNICLLCANAFTDKKVIYVDTEGSFSISRFRQITDEFKKSLKNIIFLKPTTFEEQKKSFDKLRKLITSDIGVIIVDSIAMLYRLEIGQTKDIYGINRQLGMQLSFLTEIARKNNIPILITNQVYSDFEQKDKVNIVGGDLLKYQSKCLIELKKTKEGYRKAIIRKHRSIEENKEITFKITNRGIEEVKEENAEEKNEGNSI